MKNLIVMVLLLTATLVAAESVPLAELAELSAAAEASFIESDKLSFEVTGFAGKAKEWLRFRENDNQNINLIKLGFDVAGVNSVLVTDMNASAGKCAKDQTLQLFYLKLEPKYDVRQLMTRIKVPCLVDRSAVLKLSVVTGGKQGYYKIFHFDASPKATVR